MKRMQIFLKMGKQSRPDRLEVPGERKLDDLLDMMRKALDLPDQDPQGRKYYYWFEGRSRALFGHGTLTSEGVKNGEMLTLFRGLALPDVVLNSPSGSAPYVGANTEAIPLTTEPVLSHDPVFTPPAVNFEPLDLSDLSSDDPKNKPPDQSFFNGWTEI